jgi:hypothetical protein
VELVNTAELVFYQTVQISKMPNTVSQVENAISILIARSLVVNRADANDRRNCPTVLVATVHPTCPLFSSVRCRGSVAPRPLKRSHIWWHQRNNWRNHLDDEARLNHSASLH